MNWNDTPFFCAEHAFDCGAAVRVARVVADALGGLAGSMREFFFSGIHQVCSLVGLNQVSFDLFCTMLILLMMSFVA